MANTKSSQNSRTSLRKNAEERIRMVWNRKIAYIDLSTGKIVQKPIPRDIRIRCLGGRGINMYLLYNHVKANIDPLGPENVLLIGTGLLTGIPALGAARCDIAAKSPLTGAVGNSNVGEYFAPELRLTGFDHLVIKGKAKKPVYLWMNDGKIEIRSAAHLWGRDTFESQTIIKKDNGDDKVQCLTIGVAGEKLVRFASVRTGLKSAAGRTGMGAVMGSKNLKAVAARGTLRVDYARPDELYSYCKEMNKAVMETRWAKAQSRWGSMIIYSNTNTTGLVRTRNFQLNRLEDSEDLEPENIDRYKTGMSGCYGCLIRCRHRYELKEGPYAPIHGEGPEYSTLCSFGNLVDCNKMETILVANHLVNKYGLDSLETGNMIGWAMELYERGIIDKETTGGINLEWGNEDAVFEMIRKIAERRDFGNILAEGFKRAIAKIGKRSAYYAIQIKGMGSIISDDRPVPSFALGIATATRGADHLRSRPALDLYGLPEEFLTETYGGNVSSDYTSYEGKSRMIWWQELLYAVIDSLGLCKWQTLFCGVHMPTYKEWSKLILYATGMKLDKAQLMRIGERIYTVERMFNLREGFSRKDDTLPERFFKETTTIGLPIVKGKKIGKTKFDRMLDEYYQLHGWGKDGVPRKQTLKRLDLHKEPSHII